MIVQLPHRDRAIREFGVDFIHLEIRVCVVEAVEVPLVVLLLFGAFGDLSCYVLDLFDQACDGGSPEVALQHRDVDLRDDGFKAFPEILMSKEVR
ncbi:MAG: hypothetical protein K5799_04035 [Erythrobacter sp.]|nr:hypothetical protein [Erythrobacter sp.]